MISIPDRFEKNPNHNQAERPKKPDQRKQLVERTQRRSGDDFQSA